MGEYERTPIVSSTLLTGTMQVLVVSAMTHSKVNWLKACATQPVFFRNTLGGVVSKVCPTNWDKGFVDLFFRKSGTIGFFFFFFFFQRCFS